MVTYYWVLDRWMLDFIGVVEVCALGVLSSFNIISHTHKMGKRIGHGIVPTLALYTFRHFCTAYNRMRTPSVDKNLRKSGFANMFVSMAYMQWHDVDLHNISSMEGI